MTQTSNVWRYSVFYVIFIWSRYVPLNFILRYSEFLLIPQSERPWPNKTHSLNRSDDNVKKWSRYRPGVAQRVGRGTALLFHDRGTRRGWVVSSSPGRPHFTPRKDAVPILQEVGWAPGPVWTGGKSRPHRDSIPDRPARSSVAIPTELPGPLTIIHYHNLLTWYSPPLSPNVLKLIKLIALYIAGAGWAHVFRLALKQCCFIIMTLVTLCWGV